MKQEFIKNRIEALRASMKSENLTAVIVTSFENRIYYSGFSGSNGWLVVTPEEALLVTDGRYITQAGKECPHYEVLKAAQSYEYSIIGAVKDRDAKKSMGGRIGFEASNLTVSAFEKVREYLPGKEFVPFDSFIADPRKVKDSYELGMIREAVRVAEEAYMQILPMVKEGVTELELATELQYRMKLAGADKESFDIIIASGENGALPHATPGARKLAAGDLVTIDWGARFGEYTSDMTRTLAVGEPSEKMKKIYNITYEAQMKVLEKIGPGMTTGEADALSREHIKAAGFGEYYVHGLGHGLGIAIHEDPRLKDGEKEVLKPGHVVTVEPGIYIPGEGGVRIEDLVVITETGCEILTTTPKMKF
ncbi:MAG: Xaa-Pro peptidase family protein [Firmicutes bacterium]|nr:Xaa-Pro peptidase family protein [Bacillota bacterium]